LLSGSGNCLDYLIFSWHFPNQEYTWKTDWKSLALSAEKHEEYMMLSSHFPVLDNKCKMIHFPVIFQVRKVNRISMENCMKMGRKFRRFHKMIEKCIILHLLSRPGKWLESIIYSSCFSAGNPRLFQSVFQMYSWLGKCQENIKYSRQFPDPDNNWKNYPFQLFSR